MNKVFRPAFQGNIFPMPLTRLVARRKISTDIKKTKTYRQVLSSVREIGLIEPIVVYPGENNCFLVLDGHLRLEALIDLGVGEAPCLLSTDDEGYTYNKRVNHIPPIAQHLMLVEALKSGVPEDRIARALNVDVAAVRQKSRMLDGICPEVVELLRDRNLSPQLFVVLRKMKPMIQIATAELMSLRNDFSVSFAKTRLALTPLDLLTTSAANRQQKADSIAAQSLIEDDTETLVRNLKAVERTYGTDILTLTVACSYVEKLLGEEKIARYLARHHEGVLGTLTALTSEVRSHQPQTHNRGAFRDDTCKPQGVHVASRSVA
jgi:hypothetical protein